MHVRILRMKVDVSKASEGMALWSSKVLPELKKQKGFAGVTVLGDKASGNVVSVSYWDSQSASNEAKANLQTVAKELSDTTGSQIIEDDDCEVEVLERFQPPKSGVFARMTTIQGNPSQVPVGIANFKDNILPVIKKQQGVRTAYLFVNKAAGKSFGGSVFETEADLQKSEANVSALRAAAATKVEAKTPRVEQFEVLFTEIPTAVAKH